MILEDCFKHLPKELRETILIFFSHARLLKYIDLIQSKNKPADWANLSAFISTSHADAYASLQVINLFELLLRNKINHIFSNHYGEAWIITRIYKSVPSKDMRSKIEFALRQQYPYWRKIPNSIETIPLNYDKLVHDLDFGFWTTLFTDSYSSHWQAVFTNFYHGIASNESWQLCKASLHQRTKQDLLQIKKWRNRISHLQPWEPQFHIVLRTCFELVRSIEPSALSIMISIFRTSRDVSNSLFKPF